MRSANSAPMRPALPFDVAAFQRGLKEDRQRQREAAFLGSHLGYVERALKEIYGWKAIVDRDAIRDVITPLLPPRHTASRKHAAVHEIGHFVAYEREGLCAGTASLSGSPFDRDGWGGEATRWNDLYLEPGPWKHNPLDFCRMACVVLAGPIAEEVIAGGNAMLRTGELMAARAYSDRAASLRDIPSGELWAAIVHRAVALVERYHWAIYELAEILASRKEITRNSRGVPKILKTIERRAPIRVDDLSPKGNALARSIIAGTPRVAAFVVAKESAE